MPPTLVIAAKDLRQRLRDRSAIVLGFVAPLAVASIMSVALTGTEDVHVQLGVVDEDGGPLAAAFVEALAHPELAAIITPEPVGDTATARAAVRDGDLGAALVLPRGFSASVTGADPLAISVLGSVNASISQLVAEAVAEGFVAQLNANRLSVLAALEAGVPTEQVPDLVAAAAQLRLPEQVRREQLGSRQVRSIDYYAPSMAIFFVLFAVGFGARALLLEREAGTLDRIAAAPVPPNAVLVGKSLSVLVYATASLLTVVTVSAVGFGASWGSPVAVLALCLAMAVAVTALTAFVSAMARTERQADGMASMVVFGLALVGGNFVFLSVAPDALRTMALLTPNGWALRGFTDLATGHPALESTALPLLAILAFSTVTTGVALALGRRAVVR